MAIGVQQWGRPSGLAVHDADSSPAPTEAARPTRKASCGRPVAKAAAKIGANVETEPSMRPARPGCTMRARGTTLLLVEQNVELALGIADRAYIMDGGAIVYEAAASALLADEVLKERYCSV